eukprot:11886366-Ditylum_brightwellii.AAC.1
MEAITQDIQDGDAVYFLVKSLLKEDALQVFKNEEASQEVKDSLAFTKCLAAVTEHGRVTTMKISHEEFVDVLEDGILYQWKLELEKEWFNSSVSTFKEFLGMCKKSMTRTERGNVKTSPSRIERDVTVWENIIKASKRKSIASIM